MLKVWQFASRKGQKANSPTPRLTWPIFCPKIMCHFFKKLSYNLLTKFFNPVKIYFKSQNILWDNEVTALQSNTSTKIIIALRRVSESNFAPLAVCYLPYKKYPTHLSKAQERPSVGVTEDSSLKYVSWQILLTS